MSEKLYACISTPKVRGQKSLPPMSPLDPERSVDWQRLRLLLLRSGWDIELEDAVDTSIFRVYMRLGSGADFDSMIRLGFKILRDELVDRRRSRARASIEPRDCDALVAPEFPVAERLSTDRIPTDLRSQLGPAAVRLLDLLLRGVRANKSLAQALNTSPSSVRRRRARAVALLVRWMSSNGWGWGS